MGHRQCAAGLHLRDGVLKLLQNLWLSSTRTQPKAGDRPSLSREAGESQALKWRESWKILEVGHVPLGILEDIGGYWRYPRIIIFPTDSHFGRETRRRLDSLGAKTEGLGLLPRKSLRTQWHSWDV